MIFLVVLGFLVHGKEVIYCWATSQTLIFVSVFVLAHPSVFPTLTRCGNLPSEHRRGSGASEPEPAVPSPCQLHPGSVLCLLAWLLPVERFFPVIILQCQWKHKWYQKDSFYAVSVLAFIYKNAHKKDIHRETHKSSKELPVKSYVSLNEKDQGRRV